jgi:glycosyltransferase involved in cell wall biosynthesis
MTNIEKRATTTSRKAPGKVGFVIGSLMRGGTELHLLQLLPVLKNRGWEVSIFLIGRSGPLAAEFQKAGIEIAPSQSFRIPEWLPVWPKRILQVLLLCPKFLLYAWRHRRDTIHFFLPEAFIIGALLTFSWHPRLLMSRRGLITYRKKYPAKVVAVEKFLQRRMRFLLGNSKQVVQEILDDGIPKDRVRVIYNGLAADRLDPPGPDRIELRKELGISEADIVLVALANLHPYKGHMDLIEALGLLKAAGKLPGDWTLILIGRDMPLQGPNIMPAAGNGYEVVLDKRSKALGLSEHIKFLGERADAPALLRSADIGILPSHEEGFSNALLEMMAAGLATIASNVGGSPEALDDGRAGLLVPPKNPDALADAIAMLLESPASRKSLGEIARARVMEIYTIERCADAYENVYRTLLKQE